MHLVDARHRHAVAGSDEAARQMASQVHIRTAGTISADGPDERDAVEALAQLVASGFGEETWKG